MVMNQRSPPQPPNEAARLERLRRYGLFDTPPTEAFDRITRLASRIFRVPIALVSLIDKERQWFKSKIGLTADETPRDIAFCAHTICRPDVMVVEDAVLDPRFNGNRLVVEDPGIRFYAGAPLRTADGFALGTLCIIDRVPRTFSQEERALLEDLAAFVVDEIELMQSLRNERLAQMRLIDAVEALPDGFVIYDADDRLVVCNEKYREIYAESADLLVPGASFEDIIRSGVARGQYPDAVGCEERWIQERLHRHRNPARAIEQRLPCGRWLRIEERKTQEGGYVGFRVDITEQKRREFELQYLASTDPLTGALNRRRFLELADAERRRGARYARPLAVALIDLDRFKRINDTYGHAIGDLVLRDFVLLCQGVLREQDLLCRYGGEEFALLLPETTLDGALHVSERLRAAAASRSVVTDGGSLRFTVSIGTTLCMPGEQTIDLPLARADTALYEAKIGGRDRVMVAEAPGAAPHRKQAG